MKKLFATLLCLIMSGCATSQIVLNLKDVQPDKNTGENKTQYKGKASFYIDHIIDGRTDYRMNEVGTVQTGLFNKKTPLLLNENLETVVASTLKDRMTLRGFKITESAKTSTYNITATVKNFKFTEKTTMTSETGTCEMDVSLVLLNKRMNQNVKMAASAHGDFPGLDVTDKAATALVTCVDFIVIKMIDSGLI